MSAIQLLEKIGADASVKNAKNEHLTKEEIQNLIDVCPDVYCVLIPAEDESEDSSEGEDSPKEDIGLVVNA